MLTRSVALDRVNFFIAGSNLRNPFISVICGSDDEECQDHGLNGYVEKRRGAKNAEVRRGIVGEFFASWCKGIKKTASHEDTEDKIADSFFVAYTFFWLIFSRAIGAGVAFPDLGVGILFQIVDFKMNIVFYALL